MPRELQAQGRRRARLVGPDGRLLIPRGSRSPRSPRSPVSRGGNPVCWVSTRPTVTTEVLVPALVEFLRRALSYPPSVLGW